VFRLFDARKKRIYVVLVDEFEELLPRWTVESDLSQRKFDLLSKVLKFKLNKSPVEVEHNELKGLF
jgi:hypothetical protein